MNSDFGPEMSACAFAPYVVQFCEEPGPLRGPFRHMLKAEALRARSCAEVIKSIHLMLTMHRQKFVEKAAYFMSLDYGFHPTIPYVPYLTQEENLAQSYELQRRFLDFRTGLRNLDSLSAGWLTLESSDTLNAWKASIWKPAVTAYSFFI